MTPGTGPGGVGGVRGGRLSPRGVRGDGSPRERKSQQSPGISPARGPEFAEFLRRALHAAADQVEPCSDGLAPIRARILARAGVPWPQALAISRYWLGPK
jgi:hypothetical protein